MLKYTDTDIVFQELPDGVPLAITLSGCPCRCPGCHSSQLWGDIGCELTYEALDSLIEKQRSDITAVSFMGGDAAPSEVDRLAGHIRQRFPQLRTSWWSGRTLLSPAVDVSNFDYIKLGPYLAHLGGLRSPRTNQRLYRVAPDRTLHDITPRLRRV
jgi:anaerobic ribonucleoside-triphosphate reductase activating protein